MTGVPAQVDAAPSMVTTTLLLVELPRGLRPSWRAVPDNWQRALKAANVGPVRPLLMLLLVATLVLAALGIWTAVAPGNNRWLGGDPMLGEFVLSVAPLVTAVASLVVWRRLRNRR